MVLCKKTYDSIGLIYEKSKFYKIDSKNNTYNNNNIVDSYFIIANKFYGTRFILDNCDKNLFPCQPKFSDYFYTEAEIRKIKLKKLNKKCQY